MNDQYLELDELKLSLRASLSNSTADDDYFLAIDAASRWIDGRCSDSERGIIRHFWQDDTPTTRLFCATTRQLCRVGDFDPANTVTVEVQDSLGVWSELDDDQWQAEPFVRINDFPCTEVTSTDYAGVFPLGMAPKVRVTTRWGWPGGWPSNVKQACQILSVAFMLGKDVISNEDGYSLRSAGPADPFDLAHQLLGPYLPDAGELAPFGQPPGPRAAR